MGNRWSRNAERRYSVVAIVSTYIHNGRHPSLFHSIPFAPRGGLRGPPRAAPQRPTARWPGLPALETTGCRARGCTLRALRRWPVRLPALEETDGRIKA
jgi:hypothetical protein